jgi:hypothetical protein
VSAQRPNAIRVSTSFFLWEFESPDTNTVMVDPELIYRLELLRILWGSRVAITSGYRTPAHNTQVGGLPASRHLNGKAADVAIVVVDPTATPPRTVAWIRSYGLIARSEVALFRRAAQLAGFRVDQVVDEDDHIHLEVD